MVRAEVAGLRGGWCNKKLDAWLALKLLREEKNKQTILLLSR